MWYLGLKRGLCLVEVVRGSLEFLDDAMLEAVLVSNHPKSHNSQVPLSNMALWQGAEASGFLQLLRMEGPVLADLQCKAVGDAVEAAVGAWEQGYEQDRPVFRMFGGLGRPSSYFDHTCFVTIRGRVSSLEVDERDNSILYTAYEQ